MDKALSEAEWFPPRLDTLPDDVILVIFLYCDVCSLGRLSQICRGFYRLLSEEYIWLSLSRRLTLIKFPPSTDNVDRVSPNNNTDVKSVVSRNVSIKEQCRIAKNWTEGSSRNSTLIRYHEQQLPCMQRCGKHVWVSSYNLIRRYRVFSTGHLREDVRHTLAAYPADVSQFVCRDDHIVCAYQDGSVCGWGQGGDTLWFKRPHFTTSAQCVDFRRDIVATGSKNSTLKIMRVGQESDSVQSEHVMGAGDRVWSLTLSADASVLVSGTAGCRGVSPLSLWDTQTGEHIMHLESNFKFGAGVLDVQFDAPSELLSAGYDTKLRLWDIRTGQCEREWEEPFDSTIYCFQTDSNNVMVTGTARHGMTRLWDKRRSEPIQMYYMGERSSPVYSLSFDACHLIVALDYSVNLLDFTAHIRNRSW